MNNQNGQLVLRTLEALDEPSTSIQISKEIADVVGAGLNEVKSSVKETLEGGVRFGYIQRLKNKYFSTPLDLNDNDKADISKELQDRVNRGHRMRARRKRRVGRRSGRRRS